MAKKPDMSRNSDLAGQTVSKGGYNISYDENGYATSATKHGTGGSTAAPSADAVLSGGSRSTSGGSSYDRQYLSDKDLSSLGAAQAAWQAASKAGDKAGMEAAHQEAEAIRSRYGYSGGGDGSDYIQLGYKQFNPDSGGGRSGGSVSGGGVSGGGGSFSYASAPQYVNRYQSQIDDLTAQILGRAAFEYDPEKDPTYQQYKESYTRSGERAMQDTLGQISARTGGLASSYAGSAAQQTYDNYMSALADKIPELRQLAYSMYQDEGDQQRANLEMLMALEQGDYAKYQGLLSQYNTDRSFDYGVHRDGISDQRYDTEWNYQVGRDQIADKRYEDETAYNREQDAWQKANYASETEYNQALAKAQTLAAAGDFSGYKALGYSDAEIANLKSAYDRAQAVSRASGSRSGGGSSSSKGSGSGSTTQSAGIVDTMLGFGNDTRAYEYLLSLGYSNSKSDTLWEMYQAAKESGGDGGSGGGYSLKDLNTGAVLALGIGPISYEMVEQLVEQGKVDAYTDNNGRLSVRWANGYNASNYKGNSGMLPSGRMFDVQSQLDKLLGR